MFLRSTRPADKRADWLMIGTRDEVCDVDSGTQETLLARAAV